MNWNLERGAKGFTGSLKGLIDSPLLLRVLLPGMLAILVLAPILRGNLDASTLLLSANRGLIESVAIFLVLSLAAGFPISALNDFFYRCYEGRTLWPYMLFNLATSLQHRRVTRLFNRAEKATGVQYDELWFELRAYPEDNRGDPCATHPTLLGNILAGYEAYPKRRYGMDSVFFWPRIWMELDKDKKDEINGAWSMADGLVSLSAVCLGGSLLWTSLGLLADCGWDRLEVIVSPHLPFNDPSATWWGAIAMLLGAVFFYRTSLPFHRKNGEVFKSIFDLYRGKLGPLLEIGPGETERWLRVWTYLQYGGVKCSSCGKSSHISHSKCPCGRATKENLADLSHLKQANNVSSKRTIEPVLKQTPLYTRVHLVRIGRRRR